MKLLLIGFSEQNANLLTFLVQQHFKGVDCVHIERNLTADLRFELPPVPSEHHNASGLVINLGGIGMSAYQTKHKESLSAYTQNRPTLLTTLAPIESWHEGLLGQTHYFYLQSPYNKDTILPVLQKLMNASFVFHSKQQKPEPSVAETAPMRSKQEDTTKQSTNKTEPELKQSLFDNTLLNAPNTPSQAVIEKVLKEQFNSVYELPMVKAFSKLFYQQEPFVLKTSRYDVLIDPQRNLAISTNIARVIDYLGIAKTHPEFVSSIAIEPLDKTNHAEYTKKLESQNAKKYVLNALLWQIYHAILPDEIETMAHNLQIKVKFMPNLADVEGTPSYAQAVMASCLSVPKSLDTLYTLFSEATNSALNRLFLLAMLSKIIDLDILTAQPAQNRHQSDIPNKNDGVNKATKTGFFQRLLSKLSF